jgi:outer membrane protein insertion porin family
VNSINGTTTGVGTATTNAVPLTVAWARDSRDSSLTPTVGRYQRQPGDRPGRRAEILPRGVRAPVVQAAVQKVTLALKGEIDYGHGMGNSSYPVFKNFYGGGIGSVRGYLSSSLGAVDYTYGDALGGASRLIGNAELQLPFPVRARTAACAGSASSTAARSTRKAKRCALAAALFVRPGDQLDFAGRSAQAELC